MTAVASVEQATRTRYGVLLSHAFEDEVYGDFPTITDAMEEAATVKAAQPGVEAEIMKMTGDGWRSLDGATPRQVSARRWEN